MATTLAQRMTRFKKNNGGVVPPEYRVLYRAWRQGDESAALQILTETETDLERQKDAADLLAQEEQEALLTVKGDITFMVHGEQSPPPVETVEAPKHGRSRKPATQEPPAADARAEQADPQKAG